MKAIKFLTIALALTAMQTVQAADNLNGKDNGTTIVQPTTEYFTVGDVNGDGQVNNRDLIILTRYIGGTPGYDQQISYMDAADINQDGVYNNRDVTFLQRALGNWPGFDQYLIQKEKIKL